MEPETDVNNDSIDVIVELAGKYDDIVPKLRPPTAEQERLAAVMADLSTLLDTILRLEGGTRSAIVNDLPDDINHEYEAEAVVTALQILENYGLVVLEGNTWKPGPELRS